MSLCNQAPGNGTSTLLVDTLRKPAAGTGSQKQSFQQSCG